MRFLTSIGLAALACLQAADAFVPAAREQRFASLSIRSTKNEEAPCTISEDFALDESSLVNVPNGASPIRTGIVTNYSGDFVRLGDVISSNEPHVVIFLRHMG
jgi:hypothetical protein